MDNDLCDNCLSSGVTVSHTDDSGNTVCVDCAFEAENSPALRNNT